MPAILTKTSKSKATRSKAFPANAAAQRRKSPTTRQPSSSTCISPGQSLVTLVDQYERASAGADAADHFMLKHQDDADAALAHEQAQSDYLDVAEALVEEIAALGFDVVYYGGKKYRIEPDPDFDMRLMLAC